MKFSNEKQDTQKTANAAEIGNREKSWVFKLGLAWLGLAWQL
jgi:hypothetical protein